MLKLFLKNKFVEIINWFYDMWTDGDIMFKMLAVLVALMIPGTWLGYEWLYSLEDSEKYPAWYLIFIGACGYTIVIFSIFCSYRGCTLLGRWLISNYHKAKNKTEVKFRWKE